MYYIPSDNHSIMSKSVFIISGVQLKALGLL